MDRLEALVVELKTFVEEREWSQFHDPKNHRVGGRRASRGISMDKQRRR